MSFSVCSTRAFVSLLALGAVTSFASGAHAFALQTDSSGVDVRWQVPQITVTVDASLGLVAPDAVELMERCFTPWESVDGASPPLVVVQAGAVDAIGYVPGAANQSTVRYIPEGTPLAGIALATTVLTYDATGTIVDADILLNGGEGRVFGELAAQGQGTIFGILPPYDLQNVLTHEAGHFFGMAHQNDEDSATMYPTSNRGETTKRTLSSDDEAGLKAIYAHSDASDSSTMCSAAAPGSRGGLGAAAVGAVALAAAFARRASRAKRICGAAALAACALVGLAGSSSATAAPAQDAAPTAVVRAATARHEGGLIVTALDIDLPRGETRHVEVYGGTHAGYTQVVNAQRAPAIGSQLHVDAAGEVVAAELPPVR
ncbi:MAG TPA: matrixin family metalloprotease [Byssovorax sp.]|jgi:hypothetical protein